MDGCEISERSQSSEVGKKIFFPSYIGPAVSFCLRCPWYRPIWTMQGGHIIRPPMLSYFIHLPNPLRFWQLILLCLIIMNVLQLNPNFIKPIWIFKIVSMKFCNLFCNVSPLYFEIFVWKFVGPPQQLCLLKSIVMWLYTGLLKIHGYQLGALLISWCTVVPAFWSHSPW